MDKISFKELSFLRQLLLIFGIFFMLMGFLFIFLAFNKEQLSNGNEIDEVTEYIENKPKLSVGEIKVTKTTKYLKGAEYELIYKNYMNSNGKELLDKSSGIQIVDVLGTGYKVIEKSIIINGSTYKDKSKIKVNVANGTINIDIPNALSKRTNTIELKIKLTESKSGIKYFTSQDAYYNFIPSSNNKFYGKKTSLSYLIDGNGYIKLK